MAPIAADGHSGQMTETSDRRRESTTVAHFGLVRALAEYRRFEFIRWLVRIGKLTDQIA